MIRLNSIFICSLLVLRVCFVSNIKLLNVHIANHTVLGTSTTLKCAYDLEGENLYCVKWYKDGNEFFRYMPKSKPKIQVFERDGVYIDIDNSNVNEVVLKSLKKSSSGTYRCEVSAEAPSFHTAFQDRHMITIEECLSISGIRHEYHVGETVNINCTSSKKKFHANLIWFINEEKANLKYLHGPYFKSNYEDGEKSVTTVLGLSFKVTDSHCQSRQMRLKCADQFESSYLHSDEKVINLTKSFPTESIIMNTGQLANKAQVPSISIQNTPNKFYLVFLMMFCLQTNRDVVISC